MKKWTMITLVAVLVAAPTMAGMSLVDSFSSYSNGQSLKGINGWDNTPNTSHLPSQYDPENLLVTTVNNNKVLALSNRDVTAWGGDLMLGNTGAALDIPDIAGQGTIYMKFKIDDAMNVAIATNGRVEGFCDDNATVDCQSVHAWANQATINNYEIGTKTGPDYPFRGRNGTAYEDSPTSTFKSGIWYEYWIQLDVVGQYASYYLRELGDTSAPSAIFNAGGTDQWLFRNTSYNSLTTLKFNISTSPAWNCNNTSGGDCFYQEMLIDDVGVDSSAFTFDTVPEPASLSLIALGGLLAIRRR